MLDIRLLMTTLDSRLILTSIASGGKWRPKRSGSCWPDIGGSTNVFAVGILYDAFVVKILQRKKKDENDAAGS